jgi:hypothetical protein
MLRRGQEWLEPVCSCCKTLWARISPKIKTQAQKSAHKIQHFQQNEESVKEYWST